MWGDEKCGLPVISMQKRAASEAKGGREHLWVHTDGRRSACEWAETDGSRCWGSIGVRQEGGKNVQGLPSEGV